jgi:hypothetical protein
VSNGFLAVDDTNVYFLELTGSNVAIYGIPKTGGTPNPAAAGSPSVGPATTLGANAYWLEMGSGGTHLVKMAPLKGGPAMQIAQLPSMMSPGWGANAGIAATSSAILVGTNNGFLLVPTGNGAPGSPMMVSSVTNCEELVSSPDAAYCCQFAGSVLRIASDGTVTSLGMSYNATGMGVGGPMAVDDTSAYWANFATAGTISKAPAAGGPATVLAHDTNPVAVAVDDNAVYWSDGPGNIMRIPK